MAGRRRAARSLLPSIAALVAVAVTATSPGAAAPLRRWSDTAVVESTVQEVYARPPADLLLAASNHGHAAAQQTGRKKHVKGGGKKDGKGYHHKQSAAGNDGYKHYDAFHTKSGDKYGYEQHSSFGKKKHGGKNEKYGSAHDAGFAGSHPDVEVVQQGAARLREGPRSQFLQDMSGDASVDHENTKYRRGLHDDDMFFVFSADGNENQDDGEGQQQQQQAADDDDHDDDDGEAAEQQEAADDDDEDDDGQRQKQQQEAEDDYDY